jgi:hypothetical protein
MGSMGVSQNNFRSNPSRQQEEQEDSQIKESSKACNYPSLAMAYFPYQEWRKLYDPCEAITQGTLFKELDKPFLADKKGGASRC